MQRFHFKLQKLLDYRKIREEQAEAEFAKATRVFLHEKERGGGHVSSSRNKIVAG